MTKWLLLASVLAAAAAACTPPPQALGARADQYDDADDDDDDDDDDNAPVKQSKPKTEPEAEEEVDAGPPPAPSPFKGDETFQALAPSTDSSKHHLKDTNAGKDCMSCHGPNQGAPQFAFAGTVFRDKSGSEGVTNAEVRIIDADGAELARANTDSAGNFWLLSSAVKVKPGSRVGVRDGATTKIMGASIATGACNQSGCHNKQFPITLGN